MADGAAGPDEVHALGEALDAWARARLDARALDRAHRIPPALLAELAELGGFGLTLPESVGGAGVDLPGACRLVARLARHDRSVATTVGLHLGLGTRGLVRFGTPDQLERWGPELAAGRRIAAFCATEPGAGSDLGALRTRLAAVGEGLRLDGSKAYVTNGAFAGLYTVLCQSPGLGGARRGQSLVLVDRADAGVSVGREEEKLGLRASSTTPVDFDGVRLPADRLLGAAGAGATLAGHVLAWGRTLMAAGTVGTAAAALALARRHCAGRVQFGRPLEELAVVREQLADLVATVWGLEALVAAAAADPDRLEVASLSAKVVASELSGEVCDLALQLHGGGGFVEETGVALLVRDGRVTRIFEGANDVLRVHRGLFAAAGEPGDASPLGVELAAAVDRARERLGVRLAGDHVALHRIGALATLRDAARAARARAEREGAVALADRFEDLLCARAAGLRRADADRALALRCLEWSP